MAHLKFTEEEIVKTLLLVTDCYQHTRKMIAKNQPVNMLTIHKPQGSRILTLVDILSNIDLCEVDSMEELVRAVNS